MNCYKHFLILTVITCLLSSCKEDEPEAEKFLCCGENPFVSQNVNNLGESGFRIPNVFTPNGDGNNDSYIIPFLVNYETSSVTIYDLNDKVVFNSKSNTDFFNGKYQNTGAEQRYGTYKYKIVIQNEETFVQYGYLCLVRTREEANDHDFSNCYAPQTFTGGDYVLSD